ncbi:AAA family ATPase [Prosthecomicrobium sp. N25]|uniref:AAA family ATPase n=1 Tax=Prosthecomicrobium sp. N25 TaxID=3129254 RepID=UPI003077C4D0
MDVGDWLEGLGLGRYRSAFAENGVDAVVLRRLTAEDLKEIGVLPVGHRRLLLDAIAALPGSDPPPGDAAGRDERRQVTVLFADLVGYSRLSSELDPEDVRTLLDAFFAMADKAVVDHGGTVDKHIGDCVMAVFGAPISYGNDAERAVRAAVAIRDGLGAATSRLGRALMIHAGVASGEVVASANPEAGPHGTVTGPSVNLAARLAACAGPGEILVSAAVRRAVADRCRLEDAGVFALKGFPEPLGAWRVAALLAAGPERPGTLVGRTTERALQRAALESCRDHGRGQVLYLRGEAGIGKTTLLAALREAAETMGFAVAAGAVRDFGIERGRPALASLASRLLERLHDGPMQADRERQEPLAAAGASDAERATLADLLDLPMAASLRSTLDALDALARTRSLCSVLERLVDLNARQSPLLLLAEDLHWADDATLATLGGLILSARDKPVLFGLTTRPEGDPTAAGFVLPGTVLTFDLGPLGQDEARRLAEAFAEAGPAVVEACLERAGGNPLFLEQLLQHAQSRLREAVPDSVQSIVQARMDQLPPEARQAFQTASVLGQGFALDDLRHLLDDPDYDPAILVQRQLLRREADGLVFPHALLREAAYATLLRERRRRLHARAAARCRATDPVLAAEHLLRAESAEAPAACREAAERLLSRFRHAAALDLLERALAQAPDPEDRIRLMLLRSDALLGLGEADRAEEAFTQALGSAVGPETRARALIGRASARRITDRVDAALADVDEALEVARAADLPDLEARAFALRGNLGFPKGDFAGCRRDHGESLRIARRIGSTELEAAALGGLGDVAYMVGRLVEAHASFRDCVERSAGIDLRRIAAANLPMQAITHFWVADIRGAADLALAAIEAARAIGHDRALMIAHHAAYFAERALDRPEAAKGHAAASLELARRLNAPRFVAEGLAFVAQIGFDQGNLPEAEAGFAEALALARRTGMAYMGPVFLAGRALTTRDAREREDLIREGEALLAAGSLCHNHLIFRTELIDAHLAAGAYQEAAHHAEALDVYVGGQTLPATALAIETARAGAAGSGAGTSRAAVLTALAERAEALGDLRRRSMLRRLASATPRPPVIPAPSSPR